ncbi:MAG: hypothetical protein JWN01_1078 [Patescibacteria group bacterium]|nr:hypothetical protein [Patescibacteria group bacterium]
MLRRIIAIIMLACLPVAALAALSPAPVPPGTVNIPGVLLDQSTKTTATATVNKKQGLLGYVLTFHDDKYQYAWPVCENPNLVEVDGRRITDPTGFVVGDTLVVSARANPASNPAVCIDRVVRQTISRGSSGGECLQNFQVRHEIVGSPSPLVVKTEYTYLLTVYARPTLDCDAKAYGTSPITTVIAPNRPFTISLTRDTPSGTKELTRWSLSTDPAGKASLTYTFAVPSTTYKFQVTPGGNATPGDVISWDVKVVDPNPSPSPTPIAVAAPSGSFRLTAGPFVAILILILLVAGGLEARYWLMKKREHESPEQEYRRTPRL